jgi:hypothetical protein
VAACRGAFPALLTFREFLAASRWGDATRTYEDGIRFDGMLPERPLRGGPDSAADDAPVEQQQEQRVNG